MSSMGNTYTRALAMVAVVDDDASIRAATDSLLRSRGYLVRTFESAEALLQSKELDGTACVITDVRMPGMDGIELQAILRARRSTPFVFITAFPEERVREQAMSGGAAGFLSKPYDARALLKCVETALREAAALPETS
jgi:FixJ family two-component response regulator